MNSFTNIPCSPSASQDSCLTAVELRSADFSPLPAATRPQTIQIHFPTPAEVAQVTPIGVRHFPAQPMRAASRAFGERAPDRTLALSGLASFAMLAGLFVLFIWCPVSRAQNSDWTGLEPFYATNRTALTNVPGTNAGNAWGQIPGGGITLVPGQIIWFGFQNTENLDLRKFFRIEVETADVNDIQCLKAVVDKGAFDSHGAPFDAKKQIAYLGGGFRAGKEANARYDEYRFRPQPAWEWISYQNDCDRKITITAVNAWNACALARPNFNRLQVPRCKFGALGPGVMRTNQHIREIAVFPKTIAVNPSVPPSFSAPSITGTWTSMPAPIDPEGKTHPLGGVRFVTDGPGLDPSQECSFSFTMQGPRADLQYTMYAFDAASRAFQEYNLDLSVTLHATASGNGNMLLSWPAIETGYALESTTDLLSPHWNPVIQPRATVGDQWVVSDPVTAAMKFYRLSQTTDTTPPTLVSATAQDNDFFIELSFSEPVDSASASNPLDYQLSGGIHVLDVTPMDATTIWLYLDAPISANLTYMLMASGIRDLAGNVMVGDSVLVNAPAVQVPCPGGTLLVRQVYSDCIGGFWHVVEDDWYSCPPDGTVQKFRVHDQPTTEPCAQAQAPLDPTSVIGINQNPCLNPVFDGTVIVMKCNGGAWEEWTYPLVRCPDGSIRVNPLPLQVQVANPLTPCNQPPPPPSGAR